MKNFMSPRTGVLREHIAAETQSSPSPNPKHKSSSSSRKHKITKENADPNPDPCSASKAKMKSPLPLPPRPPTSNANPLKRKLCLETLPENALPGFSDSGVKVIVRMRPPMKEDESDMVVKKVTNDSLSILDHDFTFDAVADTESTQKDIFQVVGAPLIENCLAGFNSSIFAYGQTGSGKTYTMWGPANPLLDEILSSNQKGLTPRVFEKLFERIAEEQVKHADKQLQYHCRCSFLEIYNEQITDLLDPTQGNLQIREDVKSGVYVENLTEEYVGTVKDVIHLLVKGLSNRRTGATSINAESSRSHCVFTCVVESRCKSTADGLSSIRISRINLVDLAGSERQKLTGAAGERLKEAGNINRSLSQLGNLINILADVSQSGKQRHIPYRDSKLTFLLQESLGGNAKLAMICAVSPTQSCKSETLSTLRFAQRAKAVKNKAIVNEVMQEDVKVLREVIRQLKDELLKMKENGNPNANGGYSTSWNARRSLNLLKMSLNRPMTLPHIEEDSDEEMEIVEEAVERLGVQVGLQPVVHEKDSVSDGINLQQHVKSDAEVVSQESKNTSLKMPHFDEETILMRQKSLDPSQSACISDELSDRTYVTREGSKQEVVSQNADEHGLDIDSCVVRSIDVPSSSISDGHSHQYLEENNDAEGHLVLKNSDLPDVSSAGDHIKDNLTMTDLSGRGSAIVSLVDKPSDLVDGGSEVVSPLLTVSVSPTISNSSRKSLKISSMLSASQKDVNLSFAKPLGSNPSNEHLAISLHHGLQVIDSHHRNNSILRRSSFRFSYKPVDLKVAPVEKVDVGIQTLPQVSGEPGEDSSGFLCSKCKSRIDHIEYSQANDNCNMQLVPFDGSQSPEKSKKIVPKAVENVLAGAIRREMALEEFCSKQTSEIMQLNRLIMQYKHERECNDIIAQTREDKIVRLESLMDGVLPTEEFMEEELVSLTNEHKLLKEKYENHPEVLRAKIDFKRVQDELDSYRSFFDMGERDVLIEEIQNLRSQLQYYIDSPSPMSARKRSQLLQLTHTSEPSPAPLSVIPEYTEESVADKFEQERQHWIESESNWISLSEELKNELEASRSLAVKQKKELDLEKKCSEELKEALQMAMQGHARLLEQYCDLQEKHMEMLARNRKMQEGIEDVKRAAAKAGVKGAESRFINSLAAEISALRVEREKERRYFTDENKGLQAQLRDTAEAVQAAGELLVRLKEAEEAACSAQRRASEAEQEVQRVHEQINISKGNHQNICPECHKASNNQKWQDEFEPFYKEVDGTDPSWFTGYDRCNI